MSDKKIVKKKNSGKGSAHQGAAPDTNMADAAVWEVVHDKVDDATRPIGMDDVMSWNSAPDLLSDLMPLLEEEVARAIHDPEDRLLLVASAKRNIRLAHMTLQERNPRVLARFVVEMAYDNNYRSNVSAILNGTWVRRWKNGSDGVQCYPGFPECGLPIPQHELSMLGWVTARYAADTLNTDNIVEQFEGLNPTLGWTVDPTRPPISAVRAGAEVIRREFGNSRIRIYASELGHNVAAEALVSFLPQSTVYTASTVFPQRTDVYGPLQYDAVIIGIPNAATVEFVKRAIDPDCPLNRFECDRLWKLSRMEQPEGLRKLIQDGISKVQPGGVLIVIGDVESGSHEVAVSVIANTGKFKQIPVGGHSIPVIFRYAIAPWGPFGAVPPTNRMVSAWRRST